MRRLRFIPACLAILLTACNTQLIEQTGPDSGETGRVLISLSADANNDVVEVKTASEEELVPVDDFWIEIFTSKKKRIYCEKYADAKDAVLNLNTGEYRLLAKHGDTLGVGFDHAFYLADQNFKVESRRDNQVSAVARLGNVKAKVNFGEDILNTNFYTDCYALLKNRRMLSNPLKFRKKETRPGYLPAGDLIFEVYVMMDGKLMYYPLEMTKYDPNDFITFNVEAPERKGDLVITIKVDNGTDEMPQVIKIPAESALPVEHPVLDAKSFIDGIYTVTEGDKTAPADLEIGISADGELQSLVLESDSEAFNVPASVDLMNIDEEAKAQLEAAGFVWYISKTNKYGVIDFESVATTIAKMMPYGGVEDESVKPSTFKVTVTDRLGHVETETVTINWEVSAVSTVEIPDYNAWATKIVDPKVVFTKGEPASSVLEYSRDGQNWTSAGKPKSVSGNTAVFQTITDLEPNAEYQFRVVHKGFFPRGEGSCTTEAAQQIGNSDFNSWYEDTHTYSQSGNKTRAWYRPWASGDTDTWWDVNSKKTLPASTTAAYQEYKMVPTVYYSSDAVEGNSAQLITTFVSSGANDWGDSFLGGGEPFKAAGEIFIGKADASGNHAEEGHSFSSRPTSLSFKYKYLGYNGDSFHVYMYVADAEGNKMAEEDFVGGMTSNSWTKDYHTIDINYDVMDKKAAKIYVCIRSSKKADDAVEYRKVNFSDLSISTIGGGQQKGYIGSVLFIDDLKLNY